MGSVFRAYDPKLQREVAIKRLHREDLVDDGQARLVTEARAMAHCCPIPTWSRSTTSMSSTERSRSRRITEAIGRGLAPAGAARCPGTRPERGTRARRAGNGVVRRGWRAAGGQPRRGHRVALDAPPSLNATTGPNTSDPSKAQQLGSTARATRGRGPWPSRAANRSAAAASGTCRASPSGCDPR